MNVRNDPESLNQYRGVWVLAEHSRGKIRNVTLELLGKGRELADDLDTQLGAVLLGNNVGDLCRQLISCGADRVFWVDDTRLDHYQTCLYADIITQLVRENRPEIFLFAASYLGRDLAPRLSRRLDTGLTADCTGLEIDRDTRLLVQTRPAFGGNIVASIITPQHRPQMATVRPRVMLPIDRDETRKGEAIRIPLNIDPGNIAVKILEIAKEANGGRSLAEADIIVAGGRGVGGKKNFEMIADLADALGGEVGATRDVVDAGWVSSRHQVGQTGQTVRPRLYIACGISGTIQHVAGMKDSETIVAINIDPHAPIFRISDYGIVGDLHRIVPRLTSAIRELREES